MRYPAVALAVTCALAPLAGTAAEPHELEQLQLLWGKINDFQTTITALEVDGSTQQERRFHYSFLRPEHAKAEMLSGPTKGMVAIWNGGDRVIVYRHGLLSRLRIPFGAHDKFVTSLRGNTLAEGDLGAILKCYVTHSDGIRQLDGPEIEGVATVELILEERTPLHCVGDSSKDDATITKDVIFVNRSTHLPVRRLRYAGEKQVEQWDLLDLRINTGLTPLDF